MKNFIGLLVLVFVGVVGWRVGGSLSSDAMSMAVGVLFGVLAGVPTALLLLAADRRRNDQQDERREGLGRERSSYGGSYPHGGSYPQQPPVIVLTGAPTTLQPPGYGLPGQPDPQGLQSAPKWPSERRARQFKVVGEKEEWVDEW